MDNDIFLIEVSRRGRDGDYAGAAAVAALDTRVDTLEARPNITTLDAIPNVTDNATEGQTIVKQGDGTWAGGSPAATIQVFDNTGDPINLATRNLYYGAGLNIVVPGGDPVGAQIGVVYGGTGSSDEASRSDHTHTLTPPTRVPFTPQGYMSSGTRPLQTTSVTLPSGIACIVKAKVNMQMRGGDPGPCYYQLRLTINSDARTSIGGVNGFWCVQGVPDKTTWEHHLAITGTGAAITVSADCIYYSGGGFYTDAGEIVVDIDTAR